MAPLCFLPPAGRPNRTLRESRTGFLFPTFARSRCRTRPVVRTASAQPCAPLGCPARARVACTSKSIPRRLLKLTPPPLPVRREMSGAPRADDDYDYLFKGAPVRPLDARSVPHSSTPAIQTLTRVAAGSCHYWRLGRRQVELAEPLHPQRVPPGLKIHHRCRVCHPQHPARRQDHQGTDLGHGCAVSRS